MQEEMQSEGEISLSDIFRALWTKAWIIVTALIAGVLLGAAFGFVRYHNVHYYGADVTYFVSSEKTDDGTETGGGITQAYSESILKQITGLLNSDRFNRTLMEGLEEAEGIVQDTEEEQAFFKLLNKTVSYKYSLGENKITVSVAALNAPDFAEHLLARVKATLPGYITELMSSSVFGTTTCEQLNYELCRLLNAGQTMSQMMKFGVLLGLVAAVIACAVIVIVDRTDNRLRDYEDIPSKFKLPVLGVIPRIETAEQMAGYGYGRNNKNKNTEAEK